MPRACPREVEQLASSRRTSLLLPAEPIVLLDPPIDAKISREEIFGPTVCVYHYSRLDDAIAQANSVRSLF
jgi:acyl-CoA reductase-like NAD-dependent aldehyde dehydrogenase